MAGKTKPGPSSKKPWFAVGDGNLTIVTAYFNIGNFRKGSSQTFKPSLYHEWAGVFRYIRNPLVVYTDSEETEKLFKEIRANSTSETKVIRIERNTMWSFQVVGKVREVFSQKGYPRHHPNTVVPEYTCSQHAKYEVLAQAAQKNYFNTKYFAWVDIGYFRYIVKSRKFFRLGIPPQFNHSRLGMNLINKRSMDMAPSRIYKQNLVWVGGGLCVGTADVVTRFEMQYRKTVDYFLNVKLMNTDQQVIYSMYSTHGQSAIKPEVDLQVYASTKHLDWFYLGYKMRHLE